VKHTTPNRKKYLFIFLITLLLSGVANGQLTQSTFGVQGSFRYGYLLPHRSTMGHLLQGHTSSIELGGTFQMDGSADWHHHFNMPSVSFVLNYMNFGFDEVLGSSIGTQIVSYLPYFRHKGWSAGSRLGAGIGYVNKKFDQLDNPTNNAIGSNLNALVTFGFMVEKQFDRSSLGLELNMTHLSNGAYKLPNLGLNLLLVGLQYTYYLSDLNYKSIDSNRVDILPLERKWSFHSQFIISTKQIYPTGGSNYGILSLTNYVHYQTGEKCIIEGGVDAIYNQSIIRDVPGDYGAEKNIQFGTYLGYILPIHNVELLVAMGRYVYNPLNPKGMWYHKLGSRIRLTERLQANIVIKAHWAKADFFEYGITYQW
tara:strand:- start:134086 stop:135189 length:1104 start_codon:yes stop_codon:yes gene_type:complete